MGRKLNKFCGHKGITSHSPSLVTVLTSPIMQIGGWLVAGVEIVLKDPPPFRMAISSMISMKDLSSSTADVLAMSMSSFIQPLGMRPNTPVHLATSGDQFTRDGRPGLGLSDAPIHKFAS